MIQTYANDALIFDPRPPPSVAAAEDSNAPIVVPTKKPSSNNNSGGGGANSGRAAAADSSQGRNVKAKKADVNEEVLNTIIISPPSLPISATNRSMFLHPDEEDVEVDKENGDEDEKVAGKRSSKGKKASGSSEVGRSSGGQGENEGEVKKKSKRGSGKASGGKPQGQDLATSALFSAANLQALIDEEAAFPLEPVNLNVAQGQSSAPLFRPAFGIRGPRNGFKPPTSTLYGNNQPSNAPPAADGGVPAVGYKVPGLRRKNRNT